MNRTKKAGLSVKSGLSLMCIVCLLCGLLCGFFWLAGESSALAAGPDGSAPAAKTVVSGDVSLAAPEHDEKLAVQAAAQATSPVVRTVAVGMDAGDYTETVTCRKFAGFVGSFHTGRNTGWNLAGTCLGFQKCQHVGGSICVYHGSAVNVGQETATVGCTCIIVIGRVGSQKFPPEMCRCISVFLTEFI